MYVFVLFSFIWITLLNSIELYDLYDDSKTENVELELISTTKTL